MERSQIKSSYSYFSHDWFVISATEFEDMQVFLFSKSLCPDVQNVQILLLINAKNVRVLIIRLLEFYSPVLRFKVFFTQKNIKMSHRFSLNKPYILFIY